MTETSALIAHYSTRFNDRFVTDHTVGSALGAWLLMAFLAPALRGEARARLEEELGTDAEDAATRAADLLGRPHPAVRSAVAVWDRSALLNATFGVWVASLPAAVERGPMPAQQAADAWVDSHTEGLIRQLPLAIDYLTAVVLVSALATAVWWSTPFEPVAASELGGEFGASVTTALRAPPSHTCQIAVTEAAGMVGVHVAETDDGLRVLSVIADRDVSASRVHRAAQQVAFAHLENPAHATMADLFDLPLGDGHAWTITERTYEGHGPDRVQRVEAILAAWSALGGHELMDAPGMADATSALAAMVAPAYTPASIEAHQTAIAQYTRTGFRAAAVTEIAMAATATIRDSHPVTLRTATLRFNRPYAVSAIAMGHTLTKVIQTPKWIDIPVFSAWIARVDDTHLADEPK